jgi:Domain of unknown function (DUF5668)
MTDAQRQQRNLVGTLIGVTIMLFGIGLFLDQTGVIDVAGYLTLWPVVLITIGLVKLSHRRDDGRREGGWWVVAGAWMLLNHMRVLRLRESWPLFLVAIGISMVWKEVRARARVE